MEDSRWNVGAERKQLIVVDTDELRTLIGEAVVDALARAQPPANESPWLNAQEVCQLLRVSEPTLAKWIDEEGLPSRKVGQVRRFHRDEVNAWVRARPAVVRRAK